MLLAREMGKEAPVETVRPVRPVRPVPPTALHRPAWSAAQSKRAHQRFTMSILPRGRLFAFLNKSDKHANDLAKDGYTVVKICSEERAAELAAGVWTDLEGLNTGIKRDDPSTWHGGNWPQHTHSLLQNQGAGLWQGTCEARMETTSFWEALFGERPLLSFDAIALAKPKTQAWTFKNGKDKIVPEVAEWLHTDQAKGKPQCMHHFQGALALTKLGAAEQKTQLVIPKDGESMQSFRDRFVAAFPPLPSGNGKFDPERSEWIKHTPQEKQWLVANGLVVSPHLLPGEMLIWDSGVPHASIPGELPAGQNERNVRISCFVSAIPLSLADPNDIKVRQNMLEKGVTSGHRVTELGKSGKFLECKFPKTGRTYGKKLPNYSESRIVSGFKRASNEEITSVAGKMAKFCGGA